MCDAGFVHRGFANLYFGGLKNGFAYGGTLRLIVL
jgi:hypothetical protein